MEKERIINFMAGQPDIDEKEKVLTWISGSPGNKEEYYQLKNLWALTTPFDSPLATDGKDTELFHKNIHNKKIKILRNRITTFIRYAAVISMAFFSGKYIFQDSRTSADYTLSYNEITVPPGQMAQVTLSDGTNVFINSRSKLKYPARFNSDERKVFLSGEAYFEVKKDRSPFSVEANNLVVKVLGTQFNIMAYPEDKYYQTTLTEGKIALWDTAGNKITELRPGEQYSFDIMQNRYAVKTVKPDLYSSWKEGFYTFDHETLGGIAERLERIFAITVTIKNDKIANYKFSGTISRNVPFEQILKIIQISAPIKYQIKETHGAMDEVILY